MDSKQTKALDRLVSDLRGTAGDALRGIVLHGAEARGDHFAGADTLYLCIVLADLTPATLRLLRGPVAHWVKKGHPMPRFFTPASISESADAFPIELLDIAGDKKVLYGRDDFVDVKVGEQHLRLQCERELREKLMRVQEGYIECSGRSRALRQLLIESYLGFIEIFRGCLRLLDGEVPAQAKDIAANLCKQAKLDPAPFEKVHQLVERGSIEGDLDELFANYYQQLVEAVRVVDLLGGQKS